MLTFEPSDNEQTRCGSVPIIDDNLGLEPNELFSVRITSVTGSSAIIGDGETCVEITDNDGMGCMCMDRMSNKINYYIMLILLVQCLKSVGNFRGS